MLFWIKEKYDVIKSVANSIALKTASFSFGKSVRIAANVKVINPQQISFDDGVSVLSGVTIRSRNKSNPPTIRLGKNVKIHESSYVDDYGGTIIIGDNSGIGQLCVIAGHGGLKIGKECMIGGCTYIIPANHSFNQKGIPFRCQKESKKGIVIEDNVWIGAGCIILDGVTIGTNTVIGAGSVVTKSIPSGVLAAGNPARIIKSILTD